MVKRKRFKILIDVHELDSSLYEELKERLKDEEIGIKGKKEKEGDSSYTPCADYIIQDINGVVWGIERKSFLDCYQSILSGRIYGQLAELHGKYPGHAILLVEQPTYFPIKLRAKRFQIIKAVLTFFNERSMAMPCWLVANPEHGADLIIKLAKGNLKKDFEGRKCKVIIDD